MTRGRSAGLLAVLHSRIALSLWPSAMAAAVGFGSARLLEVPNAAVVILLGFSAMLFTYALDRALDPHERHGPSRWLAIVGGLLWIGFALVVGKDGHPSAALHSAIFPVAGLAYSRPWMNVKIGGHTIRRMKELHVAKPIYVGFVWSQLPISASLFAPHGRSTVLVLSIWSWVFLKFIINVAACDLVDVEEDRKHGVATWPVLLGQQKAIRVLHILNAVAAAPVFLAAMAGSVPWRMAWLELLALWNVACLVFVREAGKSPSTFKAAIDAGTSIVLALGVVLITS